MRIYTATNTRLKVDVVPHVVRVIVEYASYLVKIHKEDTSGILHLNKHSQEYRKLFGGVLYQPQLDGAPRRADNNQLKFHQGHIGATRYPPYN